MTPQQLPAVSPRRNRLKTRRILEYASRRPMMPESQADFGRFKRLEALGHLRRTRAGWVSTGKPYVSPQAARAAETTFDFEAHRRRFDEWEH